MVVEIGLLVLAAGLSLLAGYLLQKKQKSLVQDDKPTTLATRGAFLPRIIGTRRVGCVFAWAGDRATRKEKSGAKGSSFEGKVTVFTETGWHLLCIGPAYALHEIEQSGKKIFVGPITRLSHPSGSTIDLGNEGSFKIFWGDAGQPVNTFLGDAARVGVASRWPQTCYIEWRNKRLGSSPNWPQITYTVEVRPVQLLGPILTQSPAVMDATQVLAGDTYPITGVNNGAPGTGYFEMAGNLTSRFKPLMQIQVSGNSGLGSTQNFHVHAVSVQSGPTRTRLTFEETLTGATADGIVTPFDAQGDDGINPAHIIAELLFEEWPYGAGNDRDAITGDVDMASLEALGVRCDRLNENLPGSIIAQDGQDLKGLLGGMLQDLGVMWPMNPRTGKLEFTPIRLPVGTLPNITYDMQQGVLPEIETLHGERPVDRIVFSFSDRANNFRDMTIAVDEDGHATQFEAYRARTVQIITTTNFGAASRIAERRSFEELAGGGQIIINSNRGARLLMPGRPIIADGIEEVLRVTQVQIDPLSGDVRLTVINDFYGAPKSTFQAGGGNTGSPLQPVDQDPAFFPIEVPEFLAVGEPQTVIVVRVRKHAGISSADIYISRDDATYTIIGNDQSIMSGGRFSGSFSANTEMDLTNGPTITIDGPDPLAMLDLTADTTSWRAGRQLAILVTAAGGVEICFLKKLTALGGSSYRLDGLIRARYDTVPLTFATNDRIFVLQNDDGLLVQDVLLVPQVLLYAKSQPKGNGTFPLAQIAPQSATLYGKGVRPIPVRQIRLNLGSGSAGSGTANWGDLSYKAAGSSPADDLIVRWDWSTPRSAGSGAGLFGYGSAVADVTPEGSFLVEILDIADVLKRATTVFLPTYTYLRADRIADFTSEPASFKVRITQQRAGYNSDPTVVTITRTT